MMDLDIYVFRNLAMYESRRELWEMEVNSKNI